MRIENIIQRLSSVRVKSPAVDSADGRYSACTETWANMAANEYVEEVCLVHGGEELSRWEGASPKWSPTGKALAYAGASGICLYAVETGEHRVLAPIYESHYFMGHLALKNFEWSPDGLWIAYCSADRPADGAAANRRVAGVDPGVSGAGIPADVTVVDRLLYKTKGGRGRPSVTDDALTHIYVVLVESGEIRRVTEGSHNEHSICWSPDGTRIAFVSNRSSNPDDNQLHDLWSVELATGMVTRHTSAFGTVMQPVWGASGIAFLATTGKIATNDSPMEDTHVWVIDAKGGEENGEAKDGERRYAEAKDGEENAEAKDGERRYAEAKDREENGEAKDGETRYGGATCLTKTLDRRVEGLSWEGSWLRFTVGDRGDYVMYRADRSGRLEKEAVAARAPEMQAAEEIWYKSPDGLDIQGWLMKPEGFAEGLSYPLVLVIHGGPHNMYGYAYDEKILALAAAGYAVLYINPRGSHGYGQAFSSGNYRDWGGGDYEDLIAGVDYVLVRYRWIDGRRLGVTGQSYGGYMTNRIVTKTDRFRAAVADGSISNLISFAGTSLYHSLMESEYGGRAYDHFEALWHSSPIKDIQRVRTPTLLLHGAVDNEVPLSQAEEMYIGLKKMGVPSQLVIYNGEGHGWRPDLRPAARYDVLARIIAWMDKYLKLDDKSIQDAV